MEIFFFFTRGGSKKRDLSNQLKNGNESKKRREGSLEDLHVLNSSVLEDAR